MKITDMNLSFFKFKTNGYENIYLLCIFGLLFPIYKIVYDNFYYTGYFRYDGINADRLFVGVILVLFLFF